MCCQCFRSTRRGSVQCSNCERAEKTSRSKTAAVLHKARAFIERGWCQGAGARDARGRITLPDDPAACQWCMSGAIVAAAAALQVSDGAAHRVVRVMLGGSRIATWNDHSNRTQADVLAALAAAGSTLNARGGANLDEGDAP